MSRLSFSDSVNKEIFVNYGLRVITERVIVYAEDLIRLLSDKCFQKTEWLLCVEEALLVYRTCVHATTCYRPVDLFFSFNCRRALPFKSHNDSRDAAQSMRESRERAKQRMIASVRLKFLSFGRARRRC